ncbi:C2 family cysteine protease [Microbacterium sp. 2MCAF23]|uniref:C2 family cysteine protease n=1 Tax=Microbacterium sp. 2MCAF23 TaxID=3232985 RepID=UPI003F9E5A61
MGGKVEAGTAGVTIGGQQIRTLVGEPDVVHKTGQKMADYGHLMTQAAAQLQAIRDAEMAEWRFAGEAADTLRTHVADAAQMLSVASALYAPVGQALVDYGAWTADLQDRLNDLARQCQERWTKHQVLSSVLDGTPAPLGGDPDFDRKQQERTQAETAVVDAENDWSSHAIRWNNGYVAWLAQYKQAVQKLSDPHLESVRKGDLSSGAPLALFPNGKPNPDDVRQGRIGDCYLLSVLAGIAKGDPQKIKDLITANPDGTYTVHFHDGDITVRGDQLPDDGQPDWVRVFEGAYQVHEGSFEEFDNGGDPAAVMKAIYGGDVDHGDHRGGLVDWLTGSKDIGDCGEQIKDALSHGRPVVASASDGALGFKDGGHALTVTRMYEKDGVSIVEIRNPWGQNREHEDAIREAHGTLHNPDDGYFTMTMADFAKAFTAVDIQK